MGAWVLVFTGVLAPIFILSMIYGRGYKSRFSLARAAGQGRGEGATYAKITATRAITSAKIPAGNVSTLRPCRASRSSTRG